MGKTEKEHKMEGAKGYIVRGKGYRRLNSSNGRKRKVQLVVLGRRIKLTPAPLKLKFPFSPKKLLVGLRDAYVDMMMNIATRRMIGSTFGGDLISRFGARMAKEYDDKKMFRAASATAQL